MNSPFQIVERPPAPAGPPRLAAHRESEAEAAPPAPERRRAAERPGPVEAAWRWDRRQWSGSTGGKAVIDTALATKTQFTSAYVDGLLLHGIHKAYLRLKDPRYLDVLTRAATAYAPSKGASLDDVMHITAVVDAYDLVKTPAYKQTADTTRRIFDTYPTTSEGGFWHNTGLRGQLWGDGVFMSLSFLTRYGVVLADPTTRKLALTQLTVTAKHLLNPATGLFWHAWDETGAVDWSKTPSKTNQISWGRAMGWYVMASVMTLEALPADDPARPQVETILKDLITALAKFQDPLTGRWFQVVDTGTDPQNWTEISCSAMYTHGIWWAFQHGLVDASFEAVARKGLAGVLQKVTKDTTNRTTIATTCQGLNASADLVGNYYHHGVASNDPHGIGAFVLMWEGLQ